MKNYDVPYGVSHTNALVYHRRPPLRYFKRLEDVKTLIGDKIYLAVTASHFAAGRCWKSS